MLEAVYICGPSREGLSYLRLPIPLCRLIDYIPLFSSYNKISLVCVVLNVVFSSVYMYLHFCICTIIAILPCIVWRHNVSFIF